MTTLYHFASQVDLENFGAGIFVPTETPTERHKREQFAVLDAIAEGRAERIPTGSPHYAGFVKLMNTPLRRPVARGFRTRFDQYVPSQAEELAAFEMFRIAERDVLEAEMDRACEEASYYDQVGGYAGYASDADVMLTGAVG